MKRYISRIDPEENLKALIDFSNGNPFTLWELSFEQMDYFEREKLFSDLNNVLNIIKIVPEDKTTEFLQIFFEYYKFKEKHDISKYPDLIKKVKDFWGDIPMNFSNIDGFLCFIPLVGDKAISKYLAEDDNALYYSFKNETMLEIREKIVLKLFENNYPGLLQKMKDEYYYFSNMKHHFEFNVEQIDKDTNTTTILKKTLYELCKEEAFKNVDLIPTHNTLFNYNGQNQNDYHEWLKIQIKEKNNKNIEYFRDNIFVKLQEEEKEYIIPALFTEQNNLKLFNSFLLKGFNLNSIYDYQPKKYSILSALNEYQDKNLIKKMIRRGYINLLDYKIDVDNTLKFSIENLLPYNHKEQLKAISCEDYFDSNKVFHYLVNNKIKIKEYYKQEGAQTYSTRPHIEKEFTIAQVCTHKKSEHFLEVINFNPREYNKHLGNLDQEFKYKKYEELKDEKKLLFIENLLEKTYFGETYKVTHSNWDSHKKYRTNLSNIYFSDYSTKNSIHLISEHLSLIEKLNIKSPKFIDSYFDFVIDLVEGSFYSIRRLEKTSLPVSQVSQIIDLVSDQKQMNWNYLKLELDKIKPEEKAFSETTEMVYSHIHLVTLKHLLNSEQNNIQKKLKI